MSKKSSDTEFIVYNNCGGEVLITTKKSESKFKRVFFKEGGRNLDEYDRTVTIDSGISVEADLKVW